MLSMRKSKGKNCILKVPGAERYREPRSSFSPEKGMLGINHEDTTFAELRTRLSVRNVGNLMKKQQNLRK